MRNISKYNKRVTIEINLLRINSKFSMSKSILDFLIYPVLSKISIDPTINPSNNWYIGLIGLKYARTIEKYIEFRIKQIKFNNLL
jgi:hypothetical protein